LKDLPLAVRWRRCSRLGRASSPTVGERALPASQQIGNLGTWEVSRGALKGIAPIWGLWKPAKSRGSYVCCAVNQFAQQTSAVLYTKLKVLPKNNSSWDAHARYEFLSRG